MNNSILVSFFIKIARFFINIFENSNLYKIFSRKSKPSKSVIIRKTIDDDITKYSKTYEFITKFGNANHLQKNNSKFLQALDIPFLSSKVSILMMVILVIVFKYTLKLNALYFIIPLIIVFFLIQLTQHLLDKSVYHNSKIFSFIKYIYHIEV